MIIDCHVHIGKANGKWKSNKELLKSMSEAGIDKCIQIASDCITSIEEDASTTNEAIEKLLLTLQPNFVTISPDGKSG